MCTSNAHRPPFAATLSALAAATLAGSAIAQTTDPAVAFVQHGRTEKLLVMNADGSNAATVHSTRDYLDAGPSWSPEGATIAFIKSTDLWRIDVTVVNGLPTGSNATLLLAGSIFYPAWSPLGDEIAVVDVNARTLCVIPASGGTPVVLHTSPPGVQPWYPAWSRDGTQIAFVEWVAADGAYAISLLDRVSGILTVLPNRFATTRPRFLDWARTQDVLAFDWQAAIYTLDIATGQLQLVVSSGNFPTWSPDDSRILFLDTSRGRLAVVELAHGRVTRFKTAGNWPDWRRF